MRSSAFAIDRDLIPTIDEGHLHQRIRIGGLRDVGGLVLLRAAKLVAPSHPLRGRDLTEYDPVKVILLIFQRERTATALSQIGGRGPDDERLVLQRLRLRRPAGTREQQGGEEGDSVFHSGEINERMAVLRII
jgi:hypothetical protein